MSLIYYLLKNSWYRVIVAGFAGLLSGFFQTSLIAIINQAVSDRQIQVSEQILWNFIVLTFLAFSSSLLSQYLLIILSRSAVQKLQMRLSRLILSSPLRHIENVGASRLLVILTEDVEAVSTIISSMPIIFADVSIIFGCFIYLCWLSRSMFIGTIICLFFSIIFVHILQSKALKMLKFAREERDILFEHFRTVIKGIKEFKLNSMRREAFIRNELQSATVLSCNSNIISSGIWAISSSATELLLFAILGILVFSMPLLTEVSNSILSGYILVVIYLLRPIGNILAVLPGLNRASVALQKINVISQSLKSCSEDICANQSKIQSSFKKIELAGITHVYHQENENSTFTFGPVDLNFYPGELIFIVGGNGSGKSTFAKLLSGLYIPESGKIYLDGREITNRNRETYRQLFTAVFSDFHLFERIMGIEHQKLDEQSFEYLKLLELAHKVQVTNGVLSTTKLSQGQRKRLALLAAYLEDRPIYLFDEWASDQDPSFRKIFYEQLLLDLRLKGKTILVITHDDRYFHLADRIIKLDYGKAIV
jgi:putative pyoverdin transport system ATP-binding/permease protein